jgi:hypothetical protein
MLEEKQWIMGLWKFSDHISIEDLGQVAITWAAEDPNYLQLYIRKVSKDQRGIGFTYQIPEGRDAKTTHEEYFERTSDYLKRRFGNTLVGWDIGATVWVVK